MILIERWPTSTFVSVKIDNRWIKPDLAFQRYSSGKSPPNYPVPAIPLQTIIRPDYVAVYGRYQVNFATWHK